MRSPVAIAVLTGLVLTGTDVSAESAHTLWYRRPAPQWDHALPLGNGRLGAMVFGQVNRERIQLNENTLWMGGPRDTNNPDALAALPEVRRLLFAGQPVEAYTLAEKRLMGRPFRLESYQTLGDLRLWFDHEGEVTDYRLELDLDTAIVRLTYQVNGVRYTREVFASHPAQAIVVRVTADRPGQVTMSTWIERTQDAVTEITVEDRLTLNGALGGGRGLAFQAAVKVIPEGGLLESFPERLLATQVTVLSQTGEILEYLPKVDARPSWKQADDRLEVSVMMAQRLYDNRRWPNPVVIKLTNVTPGMLPPVVETTAVARRPTEATLRATLKDLGRAQAVEVGFQYRRRKGTEDLYEKDDAWRDTPLVARAAPGEFTAVVRDLVAGQAYEFRAVVRHPLLTIYGEDKVVPEQ